MSEENTVTNNDSGEYVHRQVIVAHEHGLHARPAGKVAQTAQSFEAEIVLINDEQQVDAKSILDVLTLAAGPGEVLEVRAKGSDATEAVEALQALFKNKFEG